MTTLNTIIEEEKKEFVYKLNRLTPAGGFMLENGNYGHGMLSETFMTAFLTTAMQRAYEAGVAERDTYWKERVRETAHKTSLDALKFMNQEYKDGITGEELTKTMVRYLTNVAMNNDPTITNEDNLK